MEIVIVEDQAEAAGLVADRIEHLVAAKPEAVLGLATGSTPLALYDELVARHERGTMSFARTRAFLLDEYVGLPADHPERYRAVIDRAFTGRVDIEPSAVQGPDGAGPDLPEAGARYERAIADAGGIDLQILGIGGDGHLAFNMPMSSLASRTRLKTLTPRTRQDNARFFGDDLSAVPTHCLTQGLGTILESRHAVMLGFGRGKAQAVRECLEGPVSSRWPASVLQLHPHATVVIDEDAASQLAFAEYYRMAWSGKPSWQTL